MASEASCKVPPCFNENKSYDTWVTEVEFWAELTKIPKNQQGIAVALSLPEGSSAREKVFNELTLSDLKNDDGLTSLITFLKKHFKEEGISGIYSEYAQFDDLKREKTESMEKYIDEFDRLQKRMKKIKVQYPNSVLALKLLHRSGLSAAEKKLVLTGVDYSKEDTLYEQMVFSLKKFFTGDDYSTIAGEPGTISKPITVKSEPVMFVGTADKDNTVTTGAGQINNVYPGEPVKDEPNDIYYTTNNNGRPTGRWVWGNRRGYSRGRPWSRRPAQATSSRMGTVNSSEGFHNLPQKKTNPVDAYGRIKLCRVCGSKYHFAAKCPDNENVLVTDTSGDNREEF